MSISKPKLWVVFFAFIVSGVAGLVYESVWSHYLGLYLGHAALAQTLTLAIFMGGMALGSWLITKNNHKITNAVLVYAIIEIALGFIGLAFHGIFDATIHFSYESIFPSVGNPFVINVIKWLIASLLILPQSILLGATFPLLSSGIIRRTGKAEGGMISMLYFTNSLGAAFGAILATFILIPAIGMPGALMFAGALNILVAIIVYYVSKSPEPEFKPERSKALQKTQDVDISKTLILSVALFTGFASFVYEISWIRMLNLVLGTTLHSFEIMLSAFILGLALGGLWIRKRIDKIKNIPQYLGIIQMLMGAMAILTMPLYIESFSWVAEILKNVLMITDTGYSFYNIMTAVLAMVIMMPAAFFAGMTLPLLTMTLMKKGENEKAIGKVYAFNTVGALLGVWFAIHIGMVLLGLKHMLIFGSIIDFILGLVLFRKSRQAKGYKLSKVAPVFYLLTLAFVVFVTEFSPKTLASGTFRYARDSFDDKTEMLFYADGKSASISVTSGLNADKEKTVIIATNGKPDAGAVVGGGKSYTSDEPTMLLAGALPLLVMPEASNVANIGFGSGITANTLLASKHLERLDLIEIEPKMVEGAKFFAEKNNRVYSDPRSHIIIDDAKTYFASHNQVYDLIVSEPSNPWVMGVGNLFTEEFYRHIKNYLKDDGILVQWIQLYEISPSVVATAYNAISKEFKYFDLYRANSGDVIILVSDSPIPEIQYSKFSELPELLANDLARIGINNLDLIHSRKAGSKTQWAPLFNFYSPGINSDYFPVLSLKAPKDRFKKVNSVNLFDYSFFGLPMFEYIDEVVVNHEKILAQGFDKFHPYMASFELADRRYKSVFNEQIDMDSSFVDLGQIEVFNAATQWCGVDNKEGEVMWLSSLQYLISQTSILGSEYPMNILNKDVVIFCQENANSQAVREVLSALKLFYQKNYQQYLTTSHDLMASESTELPQSNLRGLFNHGLFAIMQLQKNNQPLGIDLKEYVSENSNLWLAHTSWLISQLQGLDAD